MSENRHLKEFDFELQAVEAHVAEDKLQQALMGSKFELKTERKQWHDTGNIVVEYESYNKPSGIAATEAEYWAHELRTKDDETLVYMLFPTKVLRKICNDLMDEGEAADCCNWRRGGQGMNMEMMLLCLKDLMERLQNFEGTGDDEFLTRKQRGE